jgi:hypothetical protein
MTAPVPAPGWYPDPSGAPGQQRYWDGQQWTVHAPPPVPQAAGVIVSGPNHAVHFILTLFTFWLCGGWAWIWLIVALSNNRRVQTVDAYGNVIRRPPPPPRQGPSIVDRLKQFKLGDGDGDGDVDTWIVWAAGALAVAVAIALIVLLVLVT